MTTPIDPAALRDDLAALRLLAIETFVEDCLAAADDGERFRRLFASGAATERLITERLQGAITRVQLVAAWPDGREALVCSIAQLSPVPEVFTREDGP